MTVQTLRAGPLGPVWWLSLLLLVVNDHVLKGAGFLPGWLTGKLSDFAGLVVAPVLLTTLVRARTPWARGLSFGSVATLFVAVKVWEPAANALVRLLGYAGLHWRLWSDPSDLLALSVLPIAWYVGAPARPPTEPRVSGFHRVLERGLVMLGVLGCLATSEIIDGYETSIYLVNLTRERVNLTVLRAEQPLDCSVVASDPVRHLTADQFTLDYRTELQRLVVLPLDRNFRRFDDTDASGSATGPTCDAVVIRASGLDDTVVFWHALSPFTVRTPVSLGEQELDEAALYLESAGGQLYIAPNQTARVWSLADAMPATSCD